MRILRGRSARAVPAEVAAELGLDRGERVLAWSTLAGGGAAVATLKRLLVRLPTGGVVSGSWTDVDHAAWEAGSSTVAVWWTGRRQPTALEVEDPSRLPEVIRERVQSSVLLSGTVTVPGGRQVRIALRRAEDGGVTTQALAPPGVRLTDPEVADTVERALAALRAEAEVGGGGFGSLHDADPA